MKRIICVLAAALLLSGCSGTESASTTTAAAASAEAWEYEYYAEDLDYYMSKYVETLNECDAAVELMDFTTLETAYDHSLDALDKFYDIVCPEPLSDYHNALLKEIDRERELTELFKEELYYLKNYDSLTPEEQTEHELLQAEIDSCLEQEYMLWSAKTAAAEAAWSYIK